MNGFMLYLFQSLICLLILYPVYWFFLKRDTFFQLNRIFLLTMILFSFVVPLLHFPKIISGSTNGMVILLDPVLITPLKIQHVLSEHMQWIEILTIIYFTGLFIFLSRFILQLIQLFILVSRFGINRYQGLRLVFVDKGYSPFSFFNLVFINKEMIPKGSLSAVLEHEQVHVRQFHSLDMILVELATIFQWFNPIIWLTGVQIKVIHEYLADEGALTSGINLSLYQQMILDETMGIRVNSLSNNFNISLLKKRIVMMTKTKSSKWLRGKLVFVVPALLILWFMFSSPSFSNIINGNVNKSHGNFIESSIHQDTLSKRRPINQNEVDAGPVMIDNMLVYQRCDEPPQYPGGDEARIKFLQDNIKYPEDAKKAGIQGKVFIRFIVEKNGHISHVEILRGVGGSIDEGALRVIKMMPDWIPGKVKGENVATQFFLPIMFAIPKDKKDK